MEITDKRHTIYKDDMGTVSVAVLSVDGCLDTVTIGANDDTIELYDWPSVYRLSDIINTILSNKECMSNETTA